VSSQTGSPKSRKKSSSKIQMAVFHGVKFDTLILARFRATDFGSFRLRGPFSAGSQQIGKNYKKTVRTKDLKKSQKVGIGLWSRNTHELTILQNVATKK
jgi:hypothetical protein